jgi:hypothetical protein
MVNDWLILMRWARGLPIPKRLDFVRPTQKRMAIWMLTRRRRETHSQKPRRSDSLTPMATYWLIPRLTVTTKPRR